MKQTKLIPVTDANTKAKFVINAGAILCAAAHPKLIGVTQLVMTAGGIVFEVTESPEELLAIVNEPNVYY